MKDWFGFRLINRCGWRTDYSLWGCYLKRGHEGPHKVPSDPRIPVGLTRPEQEEWERQMHPLSAAVTDKPDIRGLRPDASPRTGGGDTTNG